MNYTPEMAVHVFCHKPNIDGGAIKDISSPEQSYESCHHPLLRRKEAVHVLLLLQFSSLPTSAANEKNVDLWVLVLQFLQLRRPTNQSVFCTALLYVKKNQTVLLNVYYEAVSVKKLSCFILNPSVCLESRSADGAALTLSLQILH